MPSSLTIQDLNRLLFEMEPTSAIDYNNNNNTSAAAMSLGETTSVQKGPEPDTLLASIIGDLVPAAEAVAGSYHSTPFMDTPYMDTPYLDPTTPYMDHTIGTPYTPFTPAITPSLHAMNDSPRFSPFIESKDISVANYLVDDFDCGQQPPVATFNGDPAQLLLDKGKSVSTQPLTWHDEPAAESSDMLFPPLPADSQTSDFMDEDFVLTTEDNQDGFMSELLGFDFSGNITAHSDDNGQASNSSNDKNQTNDESTSNSNSSEESESSHDGEATKKRKRDDTKSNSNKRRAYNKVSSNEKKYECTICSAKFNRRYNLGTHIKTHDKNRTKEYACNVCPKSFDRKHDRDRHIATVHNGERSYACSRCPASFSRKDALTRHNEQKHSV
ncbi:hypothetical protein BJV82DRAFT_597100 [Fennellomyces sp. T-0311]|nr:hypothetical protein BJV82DRAFT_597100 [Fennellomyces sp. T-0311]